MWLSTTKHFFYCICIQILNDGKIRESNQYQNDVISPALTTTIYKTYCKLQRNFILFWHKILPVRCQETATTNAARALARSFAQTSAPARKAAKKIESGRVRLKNPLILLKNKHRLASCIKSCVCYDIIIIRDWLFLFWYKVNAIYFG